MEGEVIIIDERKETPKVGRGLLRQLHAKEITMAEFDKECSYWALKTIHELKYKLAPERPQDLTDYYDRVRRDSTYKVGSGFWQQDHIRLYNAKFTEVQSQNRGNWQWLCFMKRRIPAEDFKAQAKIREVMKTFPEPPKKVF